MLGFSIRFAGTRLSLALAMLASIAAPSLAESPRATEPDAVTDESAWQTNYAEAMKQAEKAGKLLVIHFQESTATTRGERFERETLTAGPALDVFAECVLCRLPADYRIKVGGSDVELLKHEAFAGMAGRPGLAVVDTVNSGTRQFRQVVASLPIAGTTPDADAVAEAVERHLPETALGRLSTLNWNESYGDALKRAEAEKRMLFVYFHRKDSDPLQQQFEKDAFSSLRVRRKLNRYVLARIPVDAKINVAGEPVELLKHAAFETMYGRAGFAIIDATDKDSRHFRQVVSAFPLSTVRRYDAPRMRVILGLPRGTLTQRTLIYAVRIHPEQPGSTEGQLLGLLAQEAESHSQHMADIDNQGHHNWDYRFQRISSQLSGGMAAQEVVAESWPGQELVDAAEECVHSWRQSSGHWSAVSSRQPAFGYDMKLGRRAVWYATGIFGRH